MRLLIVEDDAELASTLQEGFGEHHIQTSVATSVAEGQERALRGGYDVILLDVMLPDADGFEVCRRLRQQGQWAPVLMLTARDAVGDRVIGLDSGADDYLTKPFSFAELLARIRSLLRRTTRSQAPSTVLEVGDLTLDPATHRVTRAGQPIQLTTKEFALLEFFLRHPGEVLTRTRIIEHVWDFAYDGDSNVVDVYVRYLRGKIDRPFGRNSIDTVRGAGYRLKAEP